MNDLKESNALDLLKGFNVLWADGIADKDPIEAPPDWLEARLGGVAQKIEFLFSEMVKQRRQVLREHPYRFGVLLMWLQEPVSVYTDRDGEEAGVTRYEIMQRAGYWAGRQFDEWAEEVTDVKNKTWQGWVHVVRTFFFSQEGGRVLETAGLEPAEFVEACPMGKSLRAVSRVAAGSIEPHHVDALVDDAVTEGQMRHALRVDEKTYYKEVEEDAVAWVNQEGPRSWLDHSSLDGRLLAKSVDEAGHYTENLVARLPTPPATGLIGELQRVMVDAAQEWYDANVSPEAAVMTALVLGVRKEVMVDE